MAKFFADEAPEKREDSLELLEQESGQEVAELAAGFRDRMKKENDRYQDVVDSGYWFCACFTSRAQKEELLELLGLPADEKYIDGREIARAIKRKLKTPDLEFPGTRAFDKDYLELARD